MRLLRAALVAGLVATCVPALHASSAVRPVLPQNPALQVTGQIRTLAAYAESGLTPRQVAVLAPLDRLAASGVDIDLLNAASASSVGAAAPEQSAFLDGLGDLNGHGADVVEERMGDSGGSTTLDLFVRDGATGALLWTYSKTTRDGLSFARPGIVHGRPGLLLQTFTFSGDGFATTLTGLDARGKRAWTRTVRASLPPVTEDPGVGDSGSLDFVAQYVYTDEALRTGALEEVVVTESYSTRSSNGVQSAQSGTLRLQAISTATGALRELPGSGSSKDGAVTGDVVDDLNGNGYADLVTVDGGSAHTATARTAAGSVLWQRTDVPTHGGGYLAQVGRLTGAAAQDLVLVTSPDPGALASSGLPVSDPSATEHGQVLLLRGATGTTVWSRAGDAAYPLLRAGSPAVGILSITITRGAASSTVSATLETVDVAASSRWSRTVTAQADDDPNSPFPADVGAFALPLVDTDADGGKEGLLFVYASGKQQVFSARLLRSRDGADLRDQVGGFLGEGLTRHGTDRISVGAATAGLTVTVRSGIDGRVLAKTLVPGSKGVRRGSGTALRRGAAPCADVLVAGDGAGRTVVAVLASNGAPRWSVARATSVRGAGAVTRPKVAPAPRC